MAGIEGTADSTIEATAVGTGGTVVETGVTNAAWLFAEGAGFGLPLLVFRGKFFSVVDDDGRASRVQGTRSVFRWPLDVVDRQYGYQRARGFELQA